MTDHKTILALDVGGARVGVAKGDSRVKIAVPLTTIVVDGTEYEQIRKLISLEGPVEALVIGFPRNQSGQVTEQTMEVQRFSEGLKQLGVPLVFQDESLTSVLAEERLKLRGRYEKSDIDAEAASIILQDYLEATYGH